MNLLVIGGGNMGLTYAESIAKNTPEASISILEKDLDKIETLKSTTSFEIYDHINNCPKGIEIVLLAVKPQVIQKVFEEISSSINRSQLIISIMAGVTLKTIADGLDCTKVVRAMPNLPAQVGHGVTGYFASEKVSNSELTVVTQILEATGVVVKVTTEDQIDAITALSGSGPAYVFYFMNALMEQAKSFGFSEQASKNIVLNTFLGTSKLFETSDVDATTWMQRVTSKGGTTHAALTSFKANNLDDIIQSGAQAAYHRAKELSKD